MWYYKLYSLLKGYEDIMDNLYPHIWAFKLNTSLQINLSKLAQETENKNFPTAIKGIESVIKISSKNSLDLDSFTAG